MKQCKYCREPIEEVAKKCKTCGEPFYLFGKMLKWTPLLSILIAAGSLAIAFSEIKDKQRAVQRADVAVEAHAKVSRELNAKVKAADEALREISQKLQPASKDVMLRELRLPPRATLRDLERQAESAPADTDLQRKVFLYRALKRPENQ